MRRKLLFSGMFLFVLLSLCFVVLVEADASMWVETYVRGGGGIARSVIETSDGGYAIAGTKNVVSHSFWRGSIFGDAWLIKTDEFGVMEWNQNYAYKEPVENTVATEATSLVEASDGGYALASLTRFDNYFMLIKTDEIGHIPEYSSWLLPSLLLLATLVIIIYEKKLTTPCS